jgi:hypothetical protein
LIFCNRGHAGPGSIQMDNPVLGFFDGGELVAVLFLLIVLSPLIVLGLFILYLNISTDKKEDRSDGDKDS